MIPSYVNVLVAQIEFPTYFRGEISSLRGDHFITRISENGTIAEFGGVGIYRQ